MHLDDFSEANTIQIPAYGSWPKTVHELDRPSRWALEAALASKRPLLLRGLPGTGKSQLARAAAAALGRVFLPVVVNARMESQDLLYEYDAVQRLADAQTAALRTTAQTNTQSVIRRTKAQTDAQAEIDDLALVNYLRPRSLWWGLNWRSASQLPKPGKTPEFPDAIDPKKSGAVILIDEIDKADVDLPNGLLEILGNGAFSVPIIDESVKVDTVFPLVIITTNEDRELPPAFVRRCLVHHMALPKDLGELKSRLVHRGGLHFKKVAKKVRAAAADMLIEDREQAPDPNFLPGQAEYLDVLRALDDMGGNAKHQLEVLGEIRKFVLSKHVAGYESS